MSSTQERTGTVVALIGDLVGSRTHPSRREAQEALVAALGVVNARVATVQPLEPTIGDELQGVLATTADALRATLLLRLALPEGMDVRCGLGTGPIEVVGASAYGLTQDGPAWWAARDAVDAVKRRERRTPAARTWLQPSRPEAEDPVRTAEHDLPAGLVNAYLLCRDQVVGGLDGRGRRLALGLLDGRTHTDLAGTEGISTSAVSQRVRRDGLTTLVASLQEVPA